jgi:histone deacetylase 1/2
MDLRQGSGSFANMTSRGGCGGNNPRGGRGGGGHGHGGFGRGRDNGVTEATLSSFQLCGKEGHTVLKCYKRFDTSFTGAQEHKSASSVVSYGVDTNWYVDSGAMDNITGELEKLTMRDEYSGNDQIHTASGAGMEIKQTGQSIVHTVDRNFYVKECSLYT